MKFKRLYFFLFFIFGLGCTIVDTDLFELILEIKNQNRELLDEIRSLQSKSDSLIEELTENAAKQEALMGQVSELQEQLSEILSQFSALNEQMGSQGADIESIKEQMAALQQQYEEIIVQLEQLQQISRILSEIEILKGQLAELGAQHEELMGMFGQSQEDLQLIKGLLEFIAEQTATNTEILGVLTVQLGEQGADIKLLLEQYQEIQEQLRQLVLLGQILEEIQGLKSQQAEWEEKLQQILNGLGQNQEAINALKAEVSSLQAEFNGKLAEIMGLLNALMQDGADTEAILEELAELQASLEEIKNKLDQLLGEDSDQGGDDQNSELSDRYAEGSIFCTNGPTEIVDKINPKTGKTWMDRNLGATRAAINNSDTQAYGDYYQWGRGADGHQCRDSNTTTTLSSTNQPGHGDFILVANTPSDWRSPQNSNLWQGINGINNPCPSGYRIPTEAEFVEEYLSWENRTITGGFESPLKWVMTGVRRNSDGVFFEEANSGHNWASNISESGAPRFIFGFVFSLVDDIPRATGVPVRCIKN